MKKIITVLLILFLFAGGWLLFNSKQNQSKPFKNLEQPVDSFQARWTPDFWSLDPTTRLLARTISAEARGEPYIGQVAVGSVVMNRVRNNKFPNTIPGVIYQPWAFTAVSYGYVWNHTPEKSAVRAALDAKSGWDPSYGAIYYYNAAKVTTNWIFSRPKITRIGKHIFAR